MSKSRRSFLATLGALVAAPFAAMVGGKREPDPNWRDHDWYDGFDFEAYRKRTRVTVTGRFRISEKARAFGDDPIAYQLRQEAKRRHRERLRDVAEYLNGG